MGCDVQVKDAVSPHSWEAQGQGSQGLTPRELGQGRGRPMTPGNLTPGNSDGGTPGWSTPGTSTGSTPMSGSEPAAQPALLWHAMSSEENDHGTQHDAR